MNWINSTRPKTASTPTPQPMQTKPNFPAAFSYSTLIVPRAVRGGQHRNLTAEMSSMATSVSLVRSHVAPFETLCRLLKERCKVEQLTVLSIRARGLAQGDPLADILHAVGLLLIPENWRFQGPFERPRLTLKWTFDRKNSRHHQGPLTTVPTNFMMSKRRSSVGTAPASAMDAHFNSSASAASLIDSVRRHCVKSRILTGAVR